MNAERKLCGDNTYFRYKVGRDRYEIEVKSMRVLVFVKARVWIRFHLTKFDEKSREETRNSIL